MDELTNYVLPKGASGWTRMTREDLEYLVKRTQENAFQSGWLQGMADAREINKLGSTCLDQAVDANPPIIPLPTKPTTNNECVEKQG